MRQKQVPGMLIDVQPLRAEQKLVGRRLSPASLPYPLFVAG